MITSCRKCGKLTVMSTEEAYTPVWQCQWYERLCPECYNREKARRHREEQEWLAGVV